MLPSLSSSFPAHTGIEYPEEHFLRLSSALVDIAKIINLQDKLASDTDRWTNGETDRQGINLLDCCTL